jgi:outer membrane protein OmpA-like peptidoglycan-associated protein
MKTFFKILFVSALLISTTGVSYAQLSEANDLYNLNRFDEASAAYLRIIQKNQRGKELATERLADCYRFMGDKLEAAKWYVEAIKYPEVTSRAYLNYGVVLRDMGKYVAAKEQFLVYASQAPGDVRGNLSASYMDLLVELTGKDDDKKESGVVVANAGNVNSEFVELGAVANSPNSVVFSSTRPADSRKKKRVAEPMKLWQVELNTASGIPSFAEPTLLMPITRANASLVQGPASFTADGKTMFFTQSFSAPINDYGDLYTGFEIVYSTFDGKEWSKPTLFPHNGKDFTNAYPTISRDGTMLIFCSDMAGGYGATDLYVSRLNGDRWEKPRNLGDNVNTADVESYPVLVNDTILYFSSNGHMTFGGQDIVKSIFRDGAWTNAENMGRPINSVDDDICFFPLRNEELALFSSTRPGGKGENDIWVLSSATPPAVTVAEVKKAAPMPEPVVEPEPVIEPVKEEPKPEPVIEPKKEEPKPEPVVEPKKEEPKPAPAPVAQQPEYKSEEGLPLRSIYYDKNFIYPATKSYKTIALLLGVLKDNPSLNVHFDAFSDVQGNAEVNMRISQGRAKILVAYMQKQGIAAGRMTSAAYGDTKLVNHCKSVEQCPDEEHAKNRRVEVILRMVQASSAAQTSPQEREAVEDYIVSSVSSDIEAQSDKTPRQGLVKQFDNVTYAMNSIYPGPSTYVNIGNLIVFMEDNPEAIVELDAHSDAQGSESANKQVSDARARILSIYLQQNGVDEERIVLRSHGSTRPLNKCSVGTSCTEDEHAVNRRIEVKVKY